jgi:hypothetical protein
VLHRRNPLIKRITAKKVAVKKATAKTPAEYVRDVKEIQKLSKNLELDLQKLQKKLNALLHDPHSPIGPPPKR